MGKKLKKKAHFKCSQSSKNILSVRKLKKINNKFNKKYNQNNFKNSKSKSSSKKFYFQKKDKISKHKNNNDNTNNNPFKFNLIYNNKKEKDKERPDWMKLETKKIENIDERFHEEIKDYVNYIIPNNISLTRRQNTMQRLTKIIQKHQPNWKVVLFGSFSQNTSTVFSDLDFVILNESNYSSKNFDIKELYYLMNILRKDGFSRNIRLIKARVPILKATCSLTGINVDISVNRQNGYQAAAFIRKILEKYKVLKPTIIILKILLKKNNLNEAHTGGMSSFLLFHLVYFFFVYKFNKTNIIKNNENIIDEDSDSDDDEEDEEIASYDSNSDLKSIGKNKYINSDGKITTKAISSTEEDINSNDDDSNLVKNGVSSSNSEEENKINYDGSSEEDEESDDDIILNNTNYNNDEKNNDSEMNIGNFLFLFLRFYGFEFDYENYGFSLNKNNFGSIFIKVERIDMDCSDTICVESIQDQGTDIGKNCYNYEKIVNLFKMTYNKIKNEKQKNTISILKSLGFPSI